MQYRGFCNGSYPSAAYTADQERTVNLYFEKMESEGATSQSALYPMPGVIAGLTSSRLATEGVGGGGRAHFSQANREFAIIGNTVLEIFSDSTFSIRGTVEDDGLPATIDSNGDGGGQLFICSGNNGYIYDLAANTVSAVAALADKARFGAQLDGYFLALDTANSTVYFSNLLDGTTWDTGTDFWQRSGTGDPWVSMKVLRSYIYLLGFQTSEVWYDTGASFPFARHPSGQMQVGCSAAFSPTVVEGSLLWLTKTTAGQGAVVRASGFSPDRVSNFAFENSITGYDQISDAQGDTFYINGHSFYVLSFPAEDVASWVWDSSNGLWTELGTWDETEASDYVSWRWRWAVNVFGETRVLNSEFPAFGQLTLETSLDELPGNRGSVFLRRLRRAPAMQAELERIYISEFRLDMEPATLTNPLVTSPPQVMMRMSNDGGKTWGSERWNSGGMIGEYSTLINWHRCGVGRRRVFEVAWSEFNPFRIVNAYLDIPQRPKVSGAA